MKLNRKQSLLPGIGACVGMLALILDARTAMAGAAGGVELCVKTVIPSLFPFFVLSILLTGSLSGRRIGFLEPLGRLCGVPRGAESLLLVGALGGYPVGAQCVAQAYRQGALGKADAGRMLGFCSNAGPAFLFGMGAALFDSVAVPGVLWAIHLLSALAVGALLPGKRRSAAPVPAGDTIRLPEVVTKSVAVMAGVCGWVVLFRVLLAFLDRWCLWLLPLTGRTVVYGLLEMANGFAVLKAIAPEGLRFVLCSVFLGFGGICVTMQTSSVTARCGLGMGYYLPGKLLQTCMSLLLSCAAQVLLFPASLRWRFPILLPVLAVFAGVLILAVLHRQKKSSSIPEPVGV